jgi:hypothetical protein
MNDDRTVTVDVDLTEPMLELVMRVKSDDKSVEEFVAEAVGQRVQLAGFESHTFDAIVDVPEEAAEFGRLRAEDARMRGRDDVDDRDDINDHVDLRFNYPDEDDDE